MPVCAICCLCVWREHSKLVTDDSMLISWHACVVCLMLVEMVLPSIQFGKTVGGMRNFDNKVARRLCSAKSKPGVGASCMR